MRNYEIKSIDTPSIKNCWMIVEKTEGQVTAAWGFRTIDDAENFLEKDIPLLRGTE